MYKPADKSQISFLDFNQPMGLHMNPENRWIRMADRIPWDVFEIKYASLFPSDTGNVAKPVRMALGALIIQAKFQFPDRELVEQITENSYLQYFIGLPGYQDTPPFDASTLVLFRKRITADMLSEANEYLLANKEDKPKSPPASGEAGGAKTPDSEEDTQNRGTLAIDATCAPVNIRYPQDISLLNEAREKLEYILYRMCKSYGIPLPRQYSKRARKDYLVFAKKRKHSKKQIRAAIKKQLSYVCRDIGYLEGYFSEGKAPDARDIPMIITILKLYEQQQYMYRNKLHTVPKRIVSISQPWIRPIVRGKVKAPVGFGAKLDVSIDEEGYGHLEKVPYDAYNESGSLIAAVERYKNRTGNYPERLLADQIYRTRANRNYCKTHGIRLSGSKLGRPVQDVKTDTKQEQQDNTDRIEVERFFSRSKRCYGMGCIVTKLEETQLTSIALSVFVSNLFRIQRRILFALLWPCRKYLHNLRGYSLVVA